ncbi:AfsR/SARP family transcriptional regulator [Halarsenatibacter silvermanii]|uniref:Transcriptional regulatory protein, C terminal n=1 Tax=Halarsenatibacter silvermanii TaxID=321763 RepID=A0A1G9KIP5_9FIRM|nr:BTAD domain-containing protein [Halarsenatibacter silvermanii]SDL49658.1 Transcriptional regulatory protein, C terminal [Halarsenatibacter silvermanii]
MKRSGLKVYSLGRFIVEKNDEVISSQYSSSGKLWLLFQYLLSHPEEPVTQEKIIKDLDFDMELIDAHNALENRIYRLRKMLCAGEKYRADKYIIYKNGGYSLNWEEGGWFDVREFLRQQAEAEGAVSRGEDDTGIKCYQEALKLYKGDYLNSKYDLPWAVTKRVMYRQKFLESVISLIKLLQHKEDYSEIEKICRNAMEIEAFDEGLHKLLIRALLEQNKTDRARRHYIYIQKLSAQKDAKLFSDMDWERYKKLEEESSNKFSDINEFFAGLEYFEKKEEGLKLLEPDVFKEIMEMETRKRKRKSKDNSKSDNYVLFFNLKTTDRLAEEQSKEEEKAGIESLHEAFRLELRRGDVICRWNEFQYLVLLVDIEVPVVRRIIQRIKNTFHDLISSEEIMLNVSFKRLVARKN